MGLQRVHEILGELKRIPNTRSVEWSNAWERLKHEVMADTELSLLAYRMLETKLFDEIKKQAFDSLKASEEYNSLIEQIRQKEEWLSKQPSLPTSSQINHIIGSIEEEVNKVAEFDIESARIARHVQELLNDFEEYRRKELGR